MAKHLTVLVPSFGRPHTVAEMTQAFRETCAVADLKQFTTRLVFVVDSVDPMMRDYHAAIYTVPAIPADFDWPRWGNANGPLIPVQPQIWQSDTTGMNASLNAAAKYFTGNITDGPFAVVFMGDDHRPRTKGWDLTYLTKLALLGTGIVYGNDLLQGPNLPTQVAITSDIIRRIGYIAPPDLKHLYMDNYWKDLGEGADCIRYLPDVIVEHLHPVAGKAAWDDNYARVNAHDAHDKAAYDSFRAAGWLGHDINLVRVMRQGRVTV